MLIDAEKAMKSIDEIVCSMSVCMNSDYCHGMMAMKDAALHAIENQPTVDAVPVEWIKAKIESLKSQGNEFASLSARIIQAMLNDYGADGERR
jgi:hypothetical protein